VETEVGIIMGTTEEEIAKVETVGIVEVGFMVDY
jgi:hypothetical protein